MDAGEDFWLAVSTLCLKHGLNITNVLAALFQNADHIVAGAAAQPDQDRLHRAHTHVASTCLFGPVHDDGMTATRFAKKHRPVHPFDTRFHSALPAAMN